MDTTRWKVRHTHLVELELSLGAALAAVASRQLVEHGAAASTLVLVRVSRLVVRVVVRFHAVVVGHASGTPSPAQRTCRRLAAAVISLVVIFALLPWRRRCCDVGVTRVVTAYVTVRSCISTS